MDFYPKFIVSNQKVTSISIQRANIYADSMVILYYWINWKSVHVV